MLMPVPMAKILRHLLLLGVPLRAVGCADQGGAVDRARRQVARELVASVAAEPEPSAALGLPSAREAAALSRQALRTLWSRTARAGAA